MLRRLAAGGLLLAVAACSRAPEGDAAWAYPVAPDAGKRPVSTDPTPLHLAGSTRSFTRAQTKDLYAAPDWMPEQHPPMPRVVSHGRAPGVMACAYCHLPTGDGRPENAPLAGLPERYIIRQMAGFRDGTRASAFPDRAPSTNMTKTARAVVGPEVAAAARYFAGLRYTGHITVVESATVPRTITKGWLYSRDPAGGTEPTGQRVIELPEDFDRFELRDPAMRYTAIVPPGSIARGAALARGRYACASCHGATLQGFRDIPPLAGRSPTYLARQLNDFRRGVRHNGAGAAMLPVARRLSDADIVALAAYIADRPAH